jgi:hypothetical protein
VQNILEIAQREGYQHPAILFGRDHIAELTQLLQHYECSLEYGMPIDQPQEDNGYTEWILSSKTAGL